MTKSQEAAVAKLRRMVDHHIKAGGNIDEVKRFDVEELDYGPVYVRISIGIRGATPLMDAILSDDIRIFIGKRGGAHYWAKGDTQKRFDWTSLYRILRDQN